MNIFAVNLNLWLVYLEIGFPERTKESQTVNKRVLNCFNELRSWTNSKPLGILLKKRFIWTIYWIKYHTQQSQIFYTMISMNKRSNKRSNKRKDFTERTLMLNKCFFEQTLSEKQTKFMENKGWFRKRATERETNEMYRTLIYIIYLVRGRYFWSVRLTAVLCPLINLIFPDKPKF